MTLIQLSLYFYYGLGVVVLTPITIAIYKYKKLNQPLKYFLLGLIVYFFLYWASVITSYLSIPNRILTHLVTIIDLIFIALCFSEALQNQLIKKKIQVLSLITLFFLTVDAIFITKSDLNSLASFVKSIVVCIIIFTYLKEFVKNPYAEDFFKNPLAWIGISKLFMATTSIFTESLQIQLAKNSLDLLIKFYILNVVIAIICNFIYAVGFWQAKYLKIK